MTTTQEINLDSVFVKWWKSEMTETLISRYGESSTVLQKADAYLNGIILSNLNNRKVTLVNNYTNKIVRSNMLDLIDMITKNNLVMAGGGMLFLPHNSGKENLLFKFIRYVQEQRVISKKKRGNYEKGTWEYFKYDLEQDGWKLIINALYGSLGYPGFHLHNLFIAESITNQGRHIITTAINTIEGFLGDGMYLLSDADLHKYLNTIKKQYNKLVEDDKLIPIPTLISEDDMKVNTYKRILSICKYDISDSSKNNLKRIIDGMEMDHLNLVYYKNNMMEFNKLDFMKNRIRNIILDNGKLKFCTRRDFNENVLDQVDDTWEYYEQYVFLRMNVHDRIRKAAYMDKVKSLYTDTDSVFVSLDELYKYVRDIVFENNDSGFEYDDLRFTAVNLFLYFLNIVIDDSLNELCIGGNIAEAYHELVSMKNEFFMDRIIFITKKKRYIAKAILQEGFLLHGGKGDVEIKGFDFKKSVTKEYLRKYYTNFVEEELLNPKEINLRRVFRKLMSLKMEIDEGVRKGDPKYYKQANVKDISAYKKPYSQQGITSTTLWNVLVPNHKFDLPTDVNIAPIKALTFDKKKKSVNGLIRPDNNINVMRFKEKYPEAYQRLVDEIYGHDNELVRHMSLTSIALPKNQNIPIPDYIYDIIDYDMISQNALKLILPVTKVLGMKTLSVTSQVEHLSNMVEM